MNDASRYRNAFIQKISGKAVMRFEQVRGT